MAPAGIGYPGGAAGFDPAALRAQIQQSLPQQAQQARSGQQGLLESLRGLRPPSVNLPSQANPAASPGPQGIQGQTGGLGSGIQALIARLREQLGQQGIGGQFQQGGLPGQLPQPLQQFGAPQQQQKPQQASQPLQGGAIPFTGQPADGNGALGSQLPGFNPTPQPQPQPVQQQPAIVSRDASQPASFGQGLTQNRQPISAASGGQPTSFGLPQTQSKYGSLGSRQFAR